MNINSILKKEGIYIIKELDAFKVAKIAKRIADTLCNSFPELNLNNSNIFINISRLHMYIADLPKGLSKAKYIPVIDSIFFSKDFNININDPFVLHESIHFLQTIKDQYGNILKLGLYQLEGSITSGMAINEAAVQLMTSFALNKKNDTVKYYNIELNTISPDSYPLQCTLINQMAFFTGYNTLFDSTLYSNDNFKNLFIQKTSKKTYNIIQKNLEKILNYEDSICMLQFEIQSTDKISNIANLNKQILKYKEKIMQTFFNTQNIILEHGFCSEFNNILTLNDLNSFRNKIYSYSTILGSTPKYTFYKKFYYHMMIELDRKSELFNVSSLSLVPYNNNAFTKTLNKITLAFSKLLSTRNDVVLNNRKSNYENMK